MGPKAGPMGSRTPPTSDVYRRPGHRPVAEGEDSGLLGGARLPRRWPGTWGLIRDLRAGRYEWAMLGAWFLSFIA